MFHVFLVSNSLFFAYFLNSAKLSQFVEWWTILFENKFIWKNGLNWTIAEAKDNYPVSRLAYNLEKPNLHRCKIQV